MPILFLTQANPQRVVACGATEEKNEIENENAYEKTHDFMRILVLILVLILILVIQSLSLTLPREMLRGAAVFPQLAGLYTLYFILSTF
jgi:hypothetical protein